MLALIFWISSCSQPLINTPSVEWCTHSYRLAVSSERIDFVLLLTRVRTGDTTTYNTSWFMMEIHHKHNQHLDALNKIRAEAEDLGFTTGFLSYADAPVSSRSKRLESTIKTIRLICYLTEVTIHKCDVGRVYSTQHCVSGRSVGSR